MTNNTVKTIDTPNLTEIQKRRISKYSDKVEKNRQLMHKIYIRKNGYNALVLYGEREQCLVVTGYVKRPGSKWIEKIEDVDISICAVPKDRLLIHCDNQIICRGYKNDNDSDFMLLLYVKSQNRDCLICDTSEEKSPIFMAETIDDEEGVSINENLFKHFEQLLIGNLDLTLKKVKMDYDEGENEEDRWE